MIEAYLIDYIKLYLEEKSDLCVEETEVARWRLIRPNSLLPYNLKKTLNELKIPSGTKMRSEYELMRSFVVVLSEQLDLMVTVTDIVFGNTITELISDRDEDAMNELLRKVCSSPYLLWNEKGQEITVATVLSRIQEAVSLYQFPLAAITLSPFKLASHQFSFPLIATSLSDLTSPLPEAEVSCNGY